MRPARPTEFYCYYILENDGFITNIEAFRNLREFRYSVAGSPGHLTYARDGDDKSSGHNVRYELAQR